MPFAAIPVAHVASQIFCKSRDSLGESRDDVIGGGRLLSSTHVIIARLQPATSMREHFACLLPARAARIPGPSYASSGFVPSPLLSFFAGQALRALPQCVSHVLSAPIPHLNSTASSCLSSQLPVRPNLLPTPVAALRILALLSDQRATTSKGKARTRARTLV